MTPKFLNDLVWHLFWALHMQGRRWIKCLIFMKLQLKLQCEICSSSFQIYPLTETQRPCQQQMLVYAESIENQNIQWNLWDMFRLTINIKRFKE